MSRTDSIYLKHSTTYTEALRILEKIEKTELSQCHQLQIHTFRLVFSGVYTNSMFHSVKMSLYFSKSRLMSEHTTSSQNS